MKDGREEVREEEKNKMCPEHANLYFVYIFLTCLFCNVCNVHVGNICFFLILQHKRFNFK